MDLEMQQLWSTLKKHEKGFTFIEILIVISIIGTLAAIIYSIEVPHYHNRTYYTRAVAEMNAMAGAVTLYVAKYNDYPPDVSRGVPSGLKEFVQTSGVNNSWPNAPWPNTVYDWDNWPPDANGPEQTYQITVRFCNAGDDATCKTNAKKYLTGYVDDTTLNNWDSYSSVYYCIKGSCRAHQNYPMNHAGYCINCGSKSQFY